MDLHHTSDLSHPCNLLPIGCDLSFARYQVPGEKVVVHLGHHQTNKVIITQNPPKRSGHPLIDKTSNTEYLGNASYMRGIGTGEVEGLWLSKRPLSVCLNTQMTIRQQPNSPSSTALPFLYFPPFYAWEILVMSFYDVTIVCSIILAGKPLHMCRQTADGHLHTCWHPCQLTISNESTKCHCFISEPVFVSVTLSPRYFGVPLYHRSIY